MGKVVQRRRAITIRFDENDNELQAWLGEFAQTQNMTRIVKAALYAYAGLHAPEEIGPLMPLSNNGSESTDDPFRKLYAELEAIRATIESNPPTTILHKPTPVPHGDQALTPTSGIDMSSRRRPTKPTTAAVAAEKPPAPTISTGDAEKELLRSITAMLYKPGATASNA